jgi:hypothetical protein
VLETRPGVLRGGGLAAHSGAITTGLPVSKRG